MLRYLVIAAFLKVSAVANSTAAAPCSSWSVPTNHLLQYNTIYYADSTHSSKIGTEDIVNYISSTLASTPDECFILQGYSQGAIATIDALPLLTGASFDAVKGVFLIGNPYRKPGLACNVDVNGGSSTVDSKGVLVFLNATRAVPDDWVSKTLDVCNYGDGVCDSEHGVGITVGHMDYITSLSVQGMGAGFALRQLSGAFTTPRPSAASWSQTQPENLLPPANNGRRDITYKPASAMATSRHVQKETKILSLGLPRTGSASIASALRILGFETCHGLDLLDSKVAWDVMERAADASYPTLPTYTGVPFTREQWDELFGPYEVVTDLGSTFGPQLIQVYPDAKVILVIREFKSWFRSFDEGVLQVFWYPAVKLLIKYVEPMFGRGMGRAGHKVFLGFFAANDVDGIRRNAKHVYDNHHETIMQMVPPSQLLRYKLESGWGPLCQFLDLPIPDVEFPHTNEREMMRKRLFDMFGGILVRAAGGAFFLLVVCVIGLSLRETYN
ncbi:hypothetical protein PWT90_07837 [Aphanocladium album]|nr:hypothetical protein PWT90_07837 [Aphanocladium album]